jgi:hypothetical protein
LGNAIIASFEVAAKCVYERASLRTQPWKPRGPIGLPATCKLQSIAKPLSVKAKPYRDPANEWRSARERHGQNDIMPGVRRYDLC